MMGLILDFWSLSFLPKFVSVCAALLVVGYFYLRKNLDHFKKLNVPHKEPEMFFGNVKDRLTQKKAFHELQKEFYFLFKGSPYYGMFEGSSPVLHVASPQLIRDVLVKDFDYFMDRPVMRFKPLTPYIDKIMLFLTGKEWKQVRSAVTPAFSSGRLKAMTDLENLCGEHLTQYILSKMDDNGDGKSLVVDMKDTLGKFTLDSIASTAFGVDTNSDPQSEITVKVAKFNDIPKLSRLILLSSIFLRLPRFLTLRLPVSFFNLESIHYITGLIKSVSKQREDPKYRRNDFLQLLIDAQSRPLSKETNSEKGILLTEEVAIAQAILFFIAGYETSATTLTMLCYELASNPQVQEKVQDEVLKKLKENNGEINYELVNDLPYLDMAIAETLRMHPPVARLDRVCVKKYSLDGLSINPGDKVSIPVFGLHHDPEYFPEPEVFRPERFAQEEKEGRHQFVYLPFGAGPRNCIGLRAAQFAMKICMVHLLKEFKLERCPETKPFEFHKASMLLKAKEGIKLKITKLK